MRVGVCVYLTSKTEKVHKLPVSTFSRKPGNEQKGGALKSSCTKGIEWVHEHCFGYTVHRCVDSFPTITVWYI